MSIAKTNSSKFTLNNSIAKIKINEARSFLTCQLRKFVTEANIKWEHWLEMG